MINLIYQLIDRGFPPVYLGGNPFFFIVIKKNDKIKRILERYSRIHKTVSISGNGYGTGIQIMKI